MIVKAEGPSGTAKINSDGPKHALGLVQYLRSIGYEAWIEDADGNEIEETVNACVPALQSKYESFTEFRVEKPHSNHERVGKSTQKPLCRKTVGASAALPAG